MYLMYSMHGFFSTTFGGQNAFFIFKFTSACEINRYQTESSSKVEGAKESLGSFDREDVIK